MPIPQRREASVEEATMFGETFIRLRDSEGNGVLCLHRENGEDIRIAWAILGLRGVSLMPELLEKAARTIRERWELTGCDIERQRCEDVEKQLRTAARALRGEPDTEPAQRETGDDNGR